MTTCSSAGLQDAELLACPGKVLHEGVGCNTFPCPRKVLHEGAGCNTFSRSSGGQDVASSKSGDAMGTSRFMAALLRILSKRAACLSFAVSAGGLPAVVLMRWSGELCSDVEALDKGADCGAKCGS